MRGSIIKRGSGYTIVYYHVDADGVRKQKWEAAGPSKRKAERLLSTRLMQVERKEYVDKSISFSELTDKWLDSMKAQVKKSTFQFYQNIGRQLKAHFGYRHVKQIGPADCEAYLAAKIGKLSNRTVGYHLGVCRMIFKKAVTWGFLYRDPTEGIKRPRPEHKEVQMLGGQEVVQLLEAAEGQTRLLIATARLTGMRAGELCGLRWKDVDLVEGVIHVKRAFVRGEFTSPKSRGSKRSIIIPALLVDELAKAKEEATCELVFPNQAGRPRDWTNFLNYQWLPLLKRLGLPRVKFHSLRHLYGSTLVASGEDLAFVQRQLGHSNLSMTVNTYTHLIAHRSVGAAVRIGEAFCATQDARI